MLDAIIDALLDTLRTLPFLFAAFLLLETIEHKMGEKSHEMIKKSGRFAPFAAAILGAVPQCGFASFAAELYSTRVITLGTLMAVFISTSDEMLIVMLQSPQALGKGLIIIIIKIALAIIAGFATDIILRHKKADEQEHIGDFCKSEHCHCEGGIFRSALHHTAKITLFILIITMLLNIALYFSGEEALGRFLLKGTVFAPVVSSLVGLIPNCAASVALTEMYLSGALSFGSCLGGLISAGGVGLLVLFRSNRPIRQNFIILCLLFAIGAVTGIITDFIGIAI